MSAPATTLPDTASLDVMPGEGGVSVYAASGAWTLSAASPLAGTLDGLKPAGAVRIDLSRVERLDTVGAYLIARLAQRLRDGGRAVEIAGLRTEQRTLFDAVRAAGEGKPEPPPRRHPLIDIVADIGRGVYDLKRVALDLLAFIGLFTITALRLVAHPRRLRFTATVFHIQQTGVDALPILGLLSFLIGVVMAFQGAAQLQRFGAELFVVNLLGVSILRELGVLMTAIIVAGRSGSAFTAQIGTMKVNEEVDALSTLGLDPMELLVMPRAMALAISLPLLAFYAGIMGLLGGAVMCWVMLDISFIQFARQLQFAVGLPTVLTGLIKAPVFALTIALVGCHEGMKVARSAESVGKQTTRAVVQSIFLVIVLDALFSILFAILGV